jgi:hypothetical protein
MQMRLKSLSVRLESMLRQQLVLNQHQLEDKQQLYMLQLDSHQAALTDWSEPVLHGYLTNPFSVCSAFENFQQVLSQVFLKPSKSYIYLLKHVHAVLNSMCEYGAPPLEIVRAAKDLREACDCISELLVSGSMSSLSGDDPYEKLTQDLFERVLDDEGGIKTLLTNCRLFISLLESRYKSPELRVVLEGMHHAALKFADDLMHVVALSVASEWQKRVKKLRQVQTDPDYTSPSHPDDITLHMLEGSTEVESLLRKFPEAKPQLEMGHYIAKLVVIGVEKVSKTLLGRDSFSEDEYERINRAVDLFTSLKSRLAQAGSILQKPVLQVVASCDSADNRDDVVDLIEYLLSAEYRADEEVAKRARAKVVQTYDHLMHAISETHTENDSLFKATVAVSKQYRKCDETIKDILNGREKLAQSMWFQAYEKFKSQKNDIEKKNAEASEKYEWDRSEFGKCEKERDELVQDCVGLIEQSVILQENRVAHADMNMQGLCDKFNHLLEVENARTNKVAAVCKLDTQNLPCSEVRFVFENITIHKKDRRDYSEISNVTLFVYFVKATLASNGSRYAIIELFRETYAGVERWCARQPELRLRLEDSDSFSVGANLEVRENVLVRAGGLVGTSWFVEAADAFKRLVAGDTHGHHTLPENRIAFQPRQVEFQPSVVKIQGLSDRCKTCCLSSGRVENSSKIFFGAYAVQNVRLTVSRGISSVLETQSNSFSVQAHTLSKNLRIFMDNLQGDELEVNIRRTDTHDHNCGVCLKEFVDPVICSPCKHVFCRNCILEWLQAKETCPFCRAEGLKVEANAEDAQKRVIQAVFLSGPESAGEYWLN